MSPASDSVNVLLHAFMAAVLKSALIMQLANSDLSRTGHFGQACACSSEVYLDALCACSAFFKASLPMTPRGAGALGGAGALPSPFGAGSPLGWAAPLTTHIARTTSTGRSRDPGRMMCVCQRGRRAPKGEGKGGGVNGQGAPVKRKSGKWGGAGVLGSLVCGGGVRVGIR